MCWVHERRGEKKRGRARFGARRVQPYPDAAAFLQHEPERHGRSVKHGSVKVNVAAVDGLWLGPGAAAVGRQALHQPADLVAGRRGQPVL